MYPSFISLTDTQAEVQIGTMHIVAQYMQHIHTKLQSCNVLSAKLHSFKIILPAYLYLA